MSPKAKARAGASSPRAKQSLRLWLRLLSTHNLIEQQIRRRLNERFSCTLPQFDVLSELDYADAPQTMSQVSRRLMVTNGNLTGVVDRLERDHLVARVVSASDRRVQLLSLTEKGRQRFREMAVEHAAWLEDILGGLDRKQLDTVTEEIHRLRDQVRERIHPTD